MAENVHEMAYCTHCGKPVDEADAYCRACGGAQPVASPMAGRPESATDWRTSVAPRPLPPLGGRAIAAQVSLVFVVLALVLSIVATYRDIQLIEALRAGDDPPQATVDSVGAMFVASGLAGFAAGVAAIVTFCLWIHRASRCVHESPVGPLRFTSGWAVGWWFVPIMSFFRPYQVVAELWRASARDAEGRDWRRDNVSSLLGWWWGVYLVAGFVAGVGSTLDPVAAPTLEDAVAYEWFWIVGDVLLIVAAILAIMVVRGLSARIEAQARLVERREFAAL